MVHSAGIHTHPTQIRRAVIMDFNRVRRRASLRWSALPVGDGKGADCDPQGRFVFGPDDDPENGEREVNVGGCEPGPLTLPRPSSTRRGSDAFSFV